MTDIIIIYKYIFLIFKIIIIYFIPGFLLFLSIIMKNNTKEIFRNVSSSSGYVQLTCGLRKHTLQCRTGSK